MSRHEWIRCVKQNYANRPARSWCGQRISSFDWVFQDIEHAAFTRLDGDRLLICPECKEKIIEALNS